MATPDLVDFRQERIRVLHYTWIAFFVTFFSEKFGLGDDGWRWALAFNGFVSLAYGIAYPFLVRDLPSGEKFKGAKRTEPMTVTSWGDLALYLGWSVPLVGAMAILTWRISVSGQPAPSARDSAQIRPHGVVREELFPPSRREVFDLGCRVVCDPLQHIDQIRVWIHAL